MDTTANTPSWAAASRAASPARAAVVDAWAALVAALQGMRDAMGDAKPPGYNRLHTSAWLRGDARPEGYGYVEEATLLGASAHQKLHYKAHLAGAMDAARGLAEALGRHPSMRDKGVLVASFNAENGAFALDLQHIRFAKGSPKAILDRLLALDRVLEALPPHDGRSFRVDTFTVPAGSVDAAVVLWLALSRGGKPKAAHLESPLKGDRGQDLTVAEQISLDAGHHAQNARRTRIRRREEAGQMRLDADPSPDSGKVTP